MNLIYITNHPELAAYAQNCGVPRVMVDLESIGKHQRQGHLNTLISHHSITDVGKLRAKLDRTKLQVRLNPIHSHSEREIDQVIDQGADLLMLPMFRTKADAETFCRLVGSRAQKVLLLETAGAMVHIDQILEVDGIDEVHIGLNDLHLELGLQCMFEPLCGGLVEYLGKKILAAGLRLGIGGIARFGQGEISPKLVLAEHVRIGSTAALLSRSFHLGAGSVEELQTRVPFQKDIEDVFAWVEHLKTLAPSQLLEMRNQLDRQVRDFVAQRPTSPTPRPFQAQNDSPSHPTGP